MFRAYGLEPSTSWSVSDEQASLEVDLGWLTYMLLVAKMARAHIPLEDVLLEE